MSSLKDIFWMASPLRMDLRPEINKQLNKLNPAKAIFNIKDDQRSCRLQHWTLEIDGQCYELWPDSKQKVTPAKFLSQHCEPQHIGFKEWFQLRTDRGIQPNKRKVGQTRMTPEEIIAEYNFIWEDFNHGKYKLLTQNCQNFVKLLYSRIAAVDTDSEVSVAEKSLWHPVPDPASYKFVELSRISVVSGAVVGAGTAKVASLSTVAQAKGAISGKLAVAKIGLGSKAAGLGHVAVHAAGASKVAAIGGGMAKVGGAAALANPVAAAAMVGAGACLVYIAIKGNEDKKWTNRNKARKLLGLQTGTEEELSVGDVLEMEEELIDLEEKGELDLDENILTVVEELVIEGEKDMTESPELVHIDAEPVVQVDEALLDDNAALSDRISKIRSKVSARLASLQELVNNDGNPADRVDETAPDELVASKDRTSIISKVSDRVVPQLKTWAPKIQDLGSEGEIQPTESSDVVYLDSKSAIRVDEVALDEEPISSGRLSIKSKPSSERLSLRSKISTDQFSIKSKVSAKVASFQELLKNSDTNAVDQEDEAPLDEQIVQKDRLSIKSKVSAKVSPQLKRWKQLKT